jgi:hypothetical protein
MTEGFGFDSLQEQVIVFVLFIVRRSTVGLASLPVRCAVGTTCR